MTTEQQLSDDRKVEILRALKSEQVFGLVSIPPDAPDGIILYERGANRVGGEPAIEIPNEDPHFVDESTELDRFGNEVNVPGVSPPEKSFSKLLSEYGCIAKQQAGFSYVIVDDDACSKRP